MGRPAFEAALKAGNWAKDLLQPIDVYKSAPVADRRQCALSASLHNALHVVTWDPEVYDADFTLLMVGRLLREPPAVQAKELGQRSFAQLLQQRVERFWPALGLRDQTSVMQLIDGQQAAIDPQVLGHFLWVVAQETPCLPRRPWQLEWLLRSTATLPDSSAQKALLDILWAALSKQLLNATPKQTLQVLRLCREQQPASRTLATATRSLAATGAEAGSIEVHWLVISLVPLTCDRQPTAASHAGRPGGPAAAAEPGGHAAPRCSAVLRGPVPGRPCIFRVCAADGPTAEQHGDGLEPGSRVCHLAAALLRRQQ